MKILVEVQGYEVKLGSVKVSVEGTQEDANQLAREVSKQLAGLVQAPSIMTPPPLTPGNGSDSSARVINGELSNNGGGKRKGKKSGSGGTKGSTEEVSFVHDSAKFGTPQMTWNSGQKAIWLLYIVNEQAGVSELTAYKIAKTFNKYFKASKTIGHGNVMTALETEKLKGPNSTVGTNVTDGTTKYFLTQAGISLAQRLAKGEAVAAAA